MSRAEKGNNSLKLPRGITTGSWNAQNKECPGYGYPSALVGVYALATILVNPLSPLCSTTRNPFCSKMSRISPVRRRSFA